MTARRRTGRRRKTGVPGVLGRVILVTGLVLCAGVLGLYLTVPKGNEGEGPVDVLLVLGTPAGIHGELTDMERWRTAEAVKQFEAGEAPHLLFSGGPTSYRVCEADVMARYAAQLGVPAEAILRERGSFTTLQNIENSQAIMQTHGWHRVEVISTAEHLPRAAVLLERTDLLWRVHAAPTPGRGRGQTLLAYGEEAVGTAAWRIFGERAEPVLHLLSRGQHRVAWAFRWLFYRLERRER